MEILPAAFFLGLLSSFHCVGMCGPIALALPVHGQGTAGRVTGISLYNTGRVLTYSLLGILSGTLGMGLIRTSSLQTLSIVLGILLLAGLLLPWLAPSSGSLAFFSLWLKARFRETFKRKSRMALLVTGLLNGLLPCGMVYLALAGAAATGHVAQGALFMVAFGLGTVPAMFGISFFMSLSAAFRGRMRKLVPLVTVLMGCLLILRGLGLGIPYLSPAFSPDTTCCHKPSVELHSAHEH